MLHSSIKKCELYIGFGLGRWINIEIWADFVISSILYTFVDIFSDTSLETDVRLKVFFYWEKTTTTLYLLPLQFQRIN